MFVSSLLVIPRILQSPNNTIGLFANTSTLLCSAFGSPVPDIDWLMDGIELNLPDPHIAVTNDQEAEFVTTSYLKFTNLSFGNTGMYICRASNNLDSLQRTNSSIARLIVNREYIMPFAYEYMYVCVSNACLSLDWFLLKYLFRSSCH